MLLSLLLLAPLTTAAANGEAPDGLSSSHARVVLHHRPEGVPFEGVELHYFCLRGLGELPRLVPQHLPVLCFAPPHDLSLAAETSTDA